MSVNLSEGCVSMFEAGATGVVEVGGHLKLSLEIGSSAICVCEATKLRSRLESSMGLASPRGGGCLQTSATKKPSDGHNPLALNVATNQ